MVMDESAFIKILGSYPHVKSVVVIAIMGSERLGKSFIMNLVANYLGHVMVIIYNISFLTIILNCFAKFLLHNTIVLLA